MAQRPLYDPFRSARPGASDLLGDTQRLGEGRGAPFVADGREFAAFHEQDGLPPPGVRDTALFDGPLNVPPGGVSPLAVQDQYTQDEEGVISFNNVQFGALLRAAYRQGDMIVVPFSVGLTPLLLLPRQDSRIYLFIVNTTAAARMFLGFGAAPTALTGIPLEVNLGAYEPNVIPKNDIWVLGAAAATTGICVFSTG